MAPPSEEEVLANRLRKESERTMGKLSKDLVYHLIFMGAMFITCSSNQDVWNFKQNDELRNTYFDTKFQAVSRIT